VSDSDGANATKLTSFRGSLVGSPAWSPDSRRIAFDARPDGHPDIFTVRAEGGRTERLTTEPSDDSAPSWSTDGRWMYFSSDRDGKQQLWRMPAEGGQSERLTNGGGFASQETSDGRFLYYTRQRWSPGGLWRLPVGGGEETLVLEQLDAELDRMWTVRPEGVYFAHFDRSSRAVISFFPFSTRRPASLLSLENFDRFAPGVSVSPDGRWLLYTRIDQRNSDIFLLENVR
jgi:Tol biopolymer transport system component